MRTVLIGLLQLVLAIASALFVVLVVEAISGPFTPGSAAAFVLGMLIFHELREHVGGRL
jgi:hypothetical protein